MRDCMVLNNPRQERCDHEEWHTTDDRRQRTREIATALVATVLLVLFAGKGGKRYLRGAVVGIVAGLATYILVDRWRPTQIAPVWTFVSPIGVGTYMAVAFPVDLEKMAPQGYLPSGLPRTPSLLGSGQRERVGDQGPLVKVFVSSECNRTMYVLWDGVQDLEIPPLAKDLVLELPLGMREIKAILPGVQNADPPEIINLTQAHLKPPKPNTMTVFCFEKTNRVSVSPHVGRWD